MKTLKTMQIKENSFNFWPLLKGSTTRNWVSCFLKWKAMIKDFKNSKFSSTFISSLISANFQTTKRILVLKGFSKMSAIVSSIQSDKALKIWWRCWRRVKKWMKVQSTNWNRTRKKSHIICTTNMRFTRQKRELIRITRKSLQEKKKKL